jgi:hypothetical protein
MNSRCLIIIAALASAAALAPVTTHARTKKECAAEWANMRAANQTGTMKYRAFIKQCMSGPASAATAPATAMTTRERSCASEWNANRALGLIPAGQTWPQYWSECDKRKKAQGM